MNSHDQKEFNLYKGDVMDCMRRLCCCSTGEVDRWETETSPLMDNPYPSIDMDGVGIQVRSGVSPKLLSDLHIHAVCISYHTTQGWKLVEAPGRNQTVHTLTENKEESDSDVMAYSMQYNKDGEPFTITVKIPMGTYNSVTNHSYTEVSLNN
jgi:hypothetical protein